MSGQQWVRQSWNEMSQQVTRPLQMSMPQGRQLPAGERLTSFFFVERTQEAGLLKRRKTEVPPSSF